MAVSALAQSTAQGSANYNPITGSFGKGVVIPFYKNGTFTAPFDGLYRVRVWGGGGGSDNYTGGGGGGFALKVVELKKGSQVAVTVGRGGLAKASGQTSSFGVHCSATGGVGSNAGTTIVNNAGGVGIGGDFNAEGGTALSIYAQSTNKEYYLGGGGAASIFGDGGTGGIRYSNYVMTDTSNVRHTHGSGGGLSMGAGQIEQGGHDMPYQKIVSLDHIGAGHGLLYSQNKEATPSGGGGTQSTLAGFPAGGGGSQYQQMAAGADGLVIVEY